MDQERIDDSKRFGVWPAVVGLALATAIVALMFELATGIL